MGESTRARIAAVVARYGAGILAEPEPIAIGTLNWNYRVRTDHGDLFVRRHLADATVDRILVEHAAIVFAGDRGIPVARPLLTPANTSAVEFGGAVWAVFPWVEGRPVVRGEMSMSEVRAAGAMLGRVQAALANHPLATKVGLPMRWSRERSTVALESAIAAARRTNAADWILEAMSLQLELLARENIVPTEKFAPLLPVQACHGDYHDQQLLFDAKGEINLVCDWEMFSVRQRAMELVRSIDFALLLGTPFQAGYLAAYREHVRISPDEARAALRLWLQSRITESWAWTTYFLGGNERLVDFFPAMYAGLKKMAEPGWRAAVEERFVADAVRSP